MRNIRQTFLATLFCILSELFFPQICDASTAVDIFKAYSPGVATLRITTKDGRNLQGTGFLISSRGELLTNYHVISEAESVQVNFSEQLQYSAKRILAQDPGKDVALLLVEGVSTSVSPLQLSHSNLPEGSDIIVIGTPRGFDKTVTAGMLSGYRTIGPTSLIQFTAPISRGSSGSPVFDMNGRVIGIAIGTVQDTQGVNFALAAKEIAAFLSARPFVSTAPQRDLLQVPNVGSSAANSDTTSQSSRTTAEFSEILAQLQFLVPGQPASKVREILGLPDREASNGAKSEVWYYTGNRATLTVWYDNDAVSRSSWVEFYNSKQEAASRSESLWNSASKKFGRHAGSSQNGREWKQRGYTIAIEQHSRRDSHMVWFTAR